MSKQVYPLERQDKVNRHLIGLLRVVSIHKEQLSYKYRFRLVTDLQMIFGKARINKQMKFTYKRLS